MRILRLTSLLLAALVFAGCPGKKADQTDAGEVAPECQSRADCQGGLVCSDDKRCVPCDSSGQCLLREQCNPDSRVCEFRPGWGNDCQTNDQCQAGQWCAQGLCQDRDAVNLCPSGLDSECPKGDRCNTINSVCEEDLGCAENADCSSAEVCNTGLHACVPRCTADNQADVCGASEKCVNEMCVECAANSDCGPGLVCDQAGKCSTGSRCYTNQDCKVPLICYVQTGACLQKPPPCVSDDNCAQGYYCQVSTGKCLVSGCQPDAFEQNNDISTATPAQAKQYTGLTLCEGDIDYFALSLNRGDELGVNINADPFAENTFSALIEDSQGRVVGSGHLLANYVAPTAATYYVSISTTDLYQPYDVTFLETHATPCDDDTFEPNDSPQTATSLNSATLVDGMICPQDQDNFRFTIPATESVSVSLTNYNSGSGLLQLCLYDTGLAGPSADAGVADGGASDAGTGVSETLIGCSDDLNTPLVNAPAAQYSGHTLIANVQAENTGVSNSYSLQVTYQ